MDMVISSLPDGQAPSISPGRTAAERGKALQPWPEKHHTGLLCDCLRRGFRADTFLCVYLDKEKVFRKHLLNERRSEWVNTWQDTFSDTQSLAFYTSEGRPVDSWGRAPPSPLCLDLDAVIMNLMVYSESSGELDLNTFPSPSFHSGFPSPAFQPKSPIWERCQERGVGEQALKGS